MGYQLPFIYLTNYIKVIWGFETQLLYISYNLNTLSTQLQNYNYDPQMPN